MMSSAYLSDALQASREECDELKREIQLRDEVIAKMGAEEEEKEDVQSLLDQIDSLKTLVEQLESEKSDLAAEIKSVRDDKTALMDRFLKLQTELSETIASKADVCDENKELKLEISDMQSAARASWETDSQEVKRLQDHIQRLQSEMVSLRDVRDDNADLLSRCLEQDLNLSRVIASMEDIRDENENLKSEISGMQAAVCASDSQEEVKRLQDRILELEAEKADFQAAVTASHESTSDYIKQIEAEKSASNAEVDEARAYAQRLEAQLRDSEAMRQSMQQRIARMRARR